MSLSKSEIIFPAMKLLKQYLAGLFIIVLTSCGTLRESSKYQFIDGIYKARIFGPNPKRVYVVTGEDSIKVFRFERIKKGFTKDSLQTLVFSFPASQADAQFKPYIFRQITFDLDILTIPFKYRPPVAGFPNQLNTNFNGAAYVGYRSDTYRLSYARNPLNVYKRKIAHYGYSVGLFAGFGSTAMNPWVTNDNISSEYDGVLFIKGIAGIIGINNFTFGLGLGIDHLLDQNHKVWIYQGKPWLGLTLGLNLN